MSQTLTYSASGRRSTFGGPSTCWAARSYSIVSGWAPLRLAPLAVKYDYTGMMKDPQIPRAKSNVSSKSNTPIVCWILWPLETHTVN